MAKISKHLKDLLDYLKIPSISAQSKHKKDMSKACRWLTKTLSNINFNTKILRTKGHPIVYGENLMAGKTKPTVLIYGHYDVQDPGNLKEWTSKPFSPEIKSGNVYARGANDNKGQLMTWIAAIDHLINLPGGGIQIKSKNRNSGPGVKYDKKLPINIKFLIEGEEEIGSRNLEEFVNENKSLLDADICLVSDTDCVSETQPVITYGLRGIIYFEINVKTLPKDIHSGTYGGNVLNPVEVIVNMLSKLKNKDKRINIPNFYKNVRKVSINERKLLNQFPFTEDAIRKESGAVRVIGEKNYTTQERAGIRPALDINGIWGGYQDEGAKTIIPSEANAKFSMRIVPNQNPDEIIKNTKKYLNDNLPKGSRLKIRVLASDSAVLMDTKSRYFKVAESAYKKVFGVKPLYQLHGATIPVGGILKRVLGTDTVYMGYGLPDDGLHGSNEKFSLSMFEKGIKTNIEFLKSL